MKGPAGGMPVSGSGLTGRCLEGSWPRETVASDAHGFALSVQYVWLLAFVPCSETLLALPSRFAEGSLAYVAEQ